MASSFHANFCLADSSSGEQEVRKLSMTFDQSTDQKGCPSSDIHGGFIHVTIISTFNQELVGWMLDPYKRRDGCITFKRDDQDSSLKAIEFYEAYCVRYTEDFDAYSKDVLMLSMTISAKKIVVESATFEKKGPPWE
jgi:hypothetical protein